jgi:peptidoglycan/xylan/chitin deacetylase (PgdA/CDA1 family)
MPALIERFTSSVRRLLPTRPARLGRDGGIVSFTFDDFPRSALACGGAILERYGARGTYYAALALAGTEGATGRLFDVADLRAARASGHELACHTYRHLDCARATTAEIVADVAANADAFAALADGFAPQSFAYPFGRISFAAKRALASRFASCRGIAAGINHGLVDLGELRANRLYAAEFDEAAFRRLIDRNAACGGWLIFYTHDIAESPSRFGCTPQQFAAVVAHAAATSPVLPAGDALAALRRSSRDG